MKLSMAFAEHPQWCEVTKVLSQLQSKGFLAYIAGGAVRDGLLGRRPKDFDIATNAAEDSLRSLFPEALPVGQQFGIFIIPYDGFQIEVAGFRREGEYLDGRRPSYVEPGSAIDDANRRDFTVNALFYDPIKEEIIDYVDGQKDLGLKLIRCVGDPLKRFGEDHLRLLRACRFVAQLGFSLEEKTFDALKTQVDLITTVSPERITQEWLRLLEEQYAHFGLELANEVKLTEILFPEVRWNNSQIFDRFKNRSTHQQFREEIYSLALMLVDQTMDLFASDSLELPKFKNKVHSWLKPLRLSNNVFSELVHGLYFYREILNQKQRRRGELILSISQNRNALKWLYFWVEQLREASLFLECIQTIRDLERDKALLPWLTGKDLMDLGHPPGVQLGRMLRESHILQLEGQLKSRDQALEWARAQVLS